MTSPNQDEVILQILASGDENDDLLHRPLLEAVRRMGQGVPVSASLKDQILDDLMVLRAKPPCTIIEDTITEIIRDIADADVARRLSNRLLKLSTPLEHWDALDCAHLLNTAGDNEQATALLLAQVQKDAEELGDEDNSIEALQVLIAIGRSDMAAPLLLEIANNPHTPEHVCKDAIISLGTIEKPESQIVQGILKLAREGQTCDILRVEAAQSLVHLGQEKLAAPILSEIVLNLEIDDFDRVIAAGILGDMGEKELALAHLRTILHETDTCPIITFRAATEIAALGQREEGVQWLMQAAAAGTCCGLCDDASCSMSREYIVRMLLKLNERERAVSLLTQTLEAQVLSDSGKASHAAYLAEIGEREVATQYLLEVVRSAKPNDSAYRKAIEALGKWGERSSEVFGLLFAVARENDPQANHYWVALEALGSFGNNSPEVRKFLTKIARESPNTPQARYASGALWNLARFSSQTEP